MVSSPNRKQGEAIKSLDFLRIATRSGIKVRHIATEADFVQRGIENREWMNSTLSFEDPAPKTRYFES
jgi:hypothetical protein